MMTEKRFKIIDKVFISYSGGDAHLISNGNCKFWLWHNESGSQKVCDKLNIIMEENEQLKKELFESEKDYIMETYSDNPVRRDMKIQSLKEEFRERW